MGVLRRLSGSDRQSTSTNLKNRFQVDFRRGHLTRWRTSTVHRDRLTRQTESEERFTLEQFTDERIGSRCSQIDSFRAMAASSNIFPLVPSSLPVEWSSLVEYQIRLLISLSVASCKGERESSARYTHALKYVTRSSRLVRWICARHSLHRLPSSWQTLAP